MSWRLRTDRLAPAALAALIAACGSVPPAPETRGGPAPAEAVEPARGVADPTVAAAIAAPVEVPPRAAAEFARAVALMQAGNANEAELELQQLALAYPQLAGPHANLGILHRKAGRLDAAVAALRAAVERNPASAVAWNELGVALRMRGEFEEAEAAYERAIAVDGAFAPAHRNLGVLRDLYLGDAEGALAALERYRALTGEDKAVAGWIAELRQRTGRTAPPASTAETQPSAAPSEGA